MDDRNIPDFQLNWLIHAICFSVIRVSATKAPTDKIFEEGRPQAMKNVIGVLTILLLSIGLATPAWSEMGDDGLHKTSWMRDTFKDLSEDLAEATSEGKRLMVIIEQRGCIYCKKMHEEVYPRPEISGFIEENFFVVQINMFGDVEVTDFDGETLPEKEMVKKWGVLFTPSLMFFPETVEEKPANLAAGRANAGGLWPAYDFQSAQLGGGKGV